MIYLPFDVYPVLRPLLFLLDPEFAHTLAVFGLKCGLFPVTKTYKDPVLHTTFSGKDFAHPIGLASGFDKQAEFMPQLFELGFSSIEIGCVTPLPQPGNPKPRMFRIPGSKALINRFGFNSVGIDAFLRRLVAYRHSERPESQKYIGVNLGKNKETADAINDYVLGVRAFAPYADFLAIDISSPNTPGLRNMQAKESLDVLLQRLVETRKQTGSSSRLILKIAPDIDEAQTSDIAEASLSSGIDGIIVSNTTTYRPKDLPAKYAGEAGGLSGRPLFEMSTKLLGKIYQLTEGKIPLIGSGGVFSGADAYAKIRAGATLVQIYTGMVYEGPFIVTKILKELAALLKRDGFSCVNDAVGADYKRSK